MQLIKKFNLRTTGILIYSIYSLLTFAVSTFFNISYYFLRYNEKPIFNIKFFSYDVLINFIAPLVFIAFIFALYFFNLKKINYFIVKIFGVVSVIFSIGILCFNFNLGIHFTTIEGSLFNLFLNLCELAKISFVLFILTKLKKTFLGIFTFGLLCNLLSFILQTHNFINNYSVVFINNNAINNFNLIFNNLVSIFNFLFGIILWLYCYFEIKNKQKAIDEEIITQSIETDQEQ